MKKETGTNGPMAFNTTERLQIRAGRDCCRWGGSFGVSKFKGIKELVEVEKRVKKEGGMTSADVILTEGREVNIESLLQACQSQGEIVKSPRSK